MREKNKGQSCENFFQLHLSPFHHESIKKGTDDLDVTMVAELGLDRVGVAELALAHTAAEVALTRVA